MNPNAGPNHQQQTRDFERRDRAPDGPAQDQEQHRATQEEADRDEED